MVILFVSEDKKKDGEKRKILKDKELGGMHLFANGFSKMTKDYDINGIPHFMVFGKTENVVL